MIWITTLCLLAVFAWLLFNGLNERSWVQAHAHDETVASDEGLLPSLSAVTGSGGLPAAASSAGAGLTKSMHTVREKTTDAVGNVREKSGPALDRFKEKSGPALERIKEKSAPAIERVKEKSGPAFERVKEKSGPALERVKEKSGPALEKVKEKSGEYKERIAERRNSSSSDPAKPRERGDGVLSKLGAAAGTAARKVDGGINATMRVAGDKAESLQSRVSDNPEQQSSLGRAFGKLAATTGRVGSNMGEKARQKNDTGEDGFFTKLVDKIAGK